MKTLEEGDPGASTGKGLRCYRQRQEFLPPFETPQCYLIVGKAPPGSGRLCPRGVLVPCFGKHGWAWDTWPWLWGDPGTSSCVRKPSVPAWDLTGVGHVSLGCGTARRGVQATQSPPSAPESHSRALSPLRASTALNKAPQVPKAVPCHTSGSPEGTCSRSIPARPWGHSPPSMDPFPQHRNTSASTVETEDAEQSCVNSTPAWHQPRWESTRAIPPFLCPTAGLWLGGCLVSRAWFAQAVQAGSAVTPPPGHSCLFGFFTTFLQSNQQTRAAAGVRSKAEGSTTGDTGQCQMSPSTGEFPVPDPGHPRPRSSRAVWEPVAKLTPRSERTLPASLIASSGISIIETD